MTPRTDVFMIDVNDDRSEYAEELMELTHSRIPVYEDDPDNIIGILHIKDYLHDATHKGFEGVDIRSIIRPAYFVPETKNIDSLFRELQIGKQHLAILIDEYGGFSGIVSVEDIIEQIVGDIDDEFDEADRIIEKIDDHTYIADGNVYLDDLEEETGVELESDTSETIGGFIIDLMGEIPKEDVKYPPVLYDMYDFTILSVKDRRIEKVRIDIRDKEEGRQTVTDKD
jgi:putative hemolysin